MHWLSVVFSINKIYVNHTPLHERDLIVAYEVAMCLYLAECSLWITFCSSN